MAAFAFKENSSICLIGSTGSGKTRWVYNLMSNLPDMFEGPKISKILYCYGVYQSLFDEMQQTVSNLQFQEGIPSQQDIEALAEGQNHCLLVLDDLMSKVVASETMQDLFCQFCHHKNISVVYLTQNLYQGGKCARTIALNTSALVLMKSMRNASQIRCLATQLYPGNIGFMMGAYQDAMKEAYGYLVIDMSPSADDLYRLRTHIFPDEDTVIYMDATK